MIVIDLYCRMSFGDHGTVFKCEDQERQGRASVAEWARDQDDEVVIGKVLYDHAKSAWKPKVVRPSFNTIMDRLEAGVSQGVWVREVDRFTRKMHEAVRIADVAKGGARVLALRSTYDLTTRKGRKHFLEDAMEAEDESSKISERTRDGLMNKAGRGRSLATTRGFARPGYLPNPEGWEPGDARVRVSTEQLAREVEAVRDAAERILNGEYMNVIAQEWNASGLRTTRGGLWDGGIMRQMMEKAALAGLVEHRGVIVGKIADTDPVLEEDTWRRLQAHFAAKRRGRPATEYLLSGIVRCGQCGCTMYGRPKKNAAPYEDGSPRREYWCQTRPNQPERCGRLRIDQRDADFAVVQVVVDRLGDPQHTDRLNKRAQKVEEARGKLLGELVRLGEDMDGWASKSADWGFDRVAAAMEPLVARKVEVEAMLKRLDVHETGEEAALDVSMTWEKTTTNAQRRAMVKQAFPEGIYFTSGKSSGESLDDAFRRLQVGQPGRDTGRDTEQALKAS